MPLMDIEEVMIDGPELKPGANTPVKKERSPKHGNLSKYRKICKV
jgi:hypothetical protein